MYNCLRTAYHANVPLGPSCSTSLLSIDTPDRPTARLGGPWTSSVAADSREGDADRAEGTEQPSMEETEPELETDQPMDQGSAVNPTASVTSTNSAASRKRAATNAPVRRTASKKALRPEVEEPPLAENDGNSEPEHDTSSRSSKTEDSTGRRLGRLEVSSDRGSKRSRPRTSERTAPTGIYSLLRWQLEVREAGDERRRSESRRVRGG